MENTRCGKCSKQSCVIIITFKTNSKKHTGRLNAFRNCVERVHGKCIDVCLSHTLPSGSSVCEIGRLLKNYNVGNILKNAGIIPGFFYSIAEIHNAIIKMGTGCAPYIDCHHEIKISGSLGYFNLKFEIIDCVLPTKEDGHFTNSLSEMVYYPIDVKDAIAIENFAKERNLYRKKLENVEHFQNLYFQKLYLQKLKTYQRRW